MASELCGIMSAILYLSGGGKAYQKVFHVSICLSRESRGQGHGEQGCSKDCTGKFLPRLVQGWVLGSLSRGLATAL